MTDVVVRYKSVKPKPGRAAGEARTFNKGTGLDAVESLHKIAYQLSTINYQLSTINYQLSTINYQLSTINYQLSTINYQLSTTWFFVRVLKFFDHGP